MKAYKTISTRKTSQGEPILGKNMVANSGGGFSFKIDDWKRLDRFLVLGSSGGTYYVRERELTKENAECVSRCIQLDGVRTVNRIVEISESGRAPKNDQALFALAMCCAGGEETKKAAFAALPKVARIGTHLFHFATYVEQFRGWGRGLTSAVKSWYDSKSVDRLAYDVIKYQSRDGWAHRDLLRLAHPKTGDAARNALYKWVVDTEVIDGLHESVMAFESAKKAATAKEIVDLIVKNNLPRECIPTQFLNDASVWEALLAKMPMEAMTRNLSKMTAVGLIRPMSSAMNTVVSALENSDAIRKSRLHPFKLLTTLKIYAQGHGEKGKLEWSPVSQIADALNDAFYTAFENVEPTGKRYVLGIDCSASMTWTDNNLSACGNMQAREGAAAMALITASREKQHAIMGFSDSFMPLKISPRQRLDDVCSAIGSLNAGSTNCSLPMLWAMENKIQADVFIVYTDNETNSRGSVHPCQALQQYREKTGIPAKLIVCGMTATEFSIADQNDGGSLDVVGFDTATPQIISDFVAE